MKTILWATLTANGNYAQSSAENPPKMEAFGDFIEQARAAGNFIVGRRTFEGMPAGGENPLVGLDIVVISRSVATMPGAHVVKSPQEAIAYLQGKGHTTTLLAGGADLHNTFLGGGLVDEIIFDIAPVLEGKGYNLLLDKDNYQYKNVRLLDCKPLGNGIIHLHYAVDRA